MEAIQDMSEPRSVFIIHGHDLKVRDELVNFVKALGLETPSFEDHAGESSAPVILNVVLDGIRDADLVIALFTAEEHAALYNPATGAYEGGRENESRWQARPNVIFEAGMALGLKGDRTILVTLGSYVKLLSDLAGVHYVDLTSKDAKKTLHKKLASLLEGVPPLKGKVKTRVDAVDFARLSRPRWPHYDELHHLAQQLADHQLNKKLIRKLPAPLPETLWDVLKRVAPLGPKHGWKRDHNRTLIEEISTVYSEDIANEAYWWFIIFGVFRFNDDVVWFNGSGENWKESIKYSHLAERGVHLLQKLRLLQSA
jgi:hypothetical protein